MKKRTDLLARIERLEQRQSRPFLGRRIVFSIAGKSDDEIVGFNDNKTLHCIRQSAEPLQLFIDRAFAVTGAHCLYASYGATGAASEGDSEAEWRSAPSQT